MGPDMVITHRVVDKTPGVMDRTRGGRGPRPRPRRGTQVAIISGIKQSPVAESWFRLASFCHSETTHLRAVKMPILTVARRRRTNAPHAASGPVARCRTNPKFG